MNQLFSKSNVCAFCWNQGNQILCGKFWYSVDTATCCVGFPLGLAVSLIHRDDQDSYGICHAPYAILKGESKAVVLQKTVGRKEESVQLMASWLGTLDVTCELAGKKWSLVSSSGRSWVIQVQESRGFAVQGNSHGGCASAREMLWPYLDVDMRFSSYQSKY